MSTGKTKTRTVTLKVDLYADMTGFSSAKTVTRAHHRIARNYASPLLMGPPLTEDLLELVTHMFTEEEAELAAHLPPLLPRTAEKVARRSGRPTEEVRRVLDHLALHKMVILASGTPRKYTILPIVPGTFEMTLMTADLSSRNSWHQKFAEIFERLWDTGFLAEYVKRDRNRAAFRYLPVGEATRTLYMAWPSDHLEQVLDPYDLFAVGHCQCRVAMQLVGRGCDRPLETCVTFGPWARGVIDRGMMRQTDKTEIIEIKQQAERQGLVTWMVNYVGDPRGNGSCSCCGCCCHALRVVKEFNAPGVISTPHFRPVCDHAICTLCGKCVTTCPMDALSVVDGRWTYDRARCIGCGLCVLSCAFHALELQPVSQARPPYQSLSRLVLASLPAYLSTSLSIWARRLFTSDRS